MTQAELKRLIERYLTEELSEDEFQRLWATLQEPEHKDTWMDMIGGVWENPAYHSLADETAKQRVLEKLRPSLTAAPAPVVRKPLLVRLITNRSTWWAAAVLVLICAGAWYFLFRQEH